MKTSMINERSRGSPSFGNFFDVYIANAKHTNASCNKNILIPFFIAQL